MNVKNSIHLIAALAVTYIFVAVTSAHADQHPQNRGLIWDVARGGQKVGQTIERSPVWAVRKGAPAVAKGVVIGSRAIGTGAVVGSRAVGRGVAASAKSGAHAVGAVARKVGSGAKKVASKIISVF